MNGLTEREIEVANVLVDEGACNKIIARRLKISIGTVKIHLHHIYAKLGIVNRIQLIFLVMKWRQNESAQSTHHQYRDTTANELPPDI